MKFSRVLPVGMLALSAVALVACGGMDTPPVPVASTNLVVAASPSTAATSTALLQAAPATFTTGVPALGTTASTTVTVAKSTATATLPAGGNVTGPVMSVASGGANASGVLTFGSCVFTVTSSTFTTGPMAPPLPRQVVINPCQTTAGIQNVPANGTSRDVPLTVTFGTVTSTANTVRATIPAGSNSVTLTAADGTTIPAGTVVTVTPTGTGGG